MIESGQESADDQNNLTSSAVIYNRRIQMQLPFEVKPKSKYNAGPDHAHLRKWRIRIFDHDVDA